MTGVNKDATAKETAASTSKTAVKEEKFTVEDFMENAEALGYKKYVLAGALCGCKKEDKFTKTEIENKVKNFLGKKVR